MLNELVAFSIRMNKPVLSTYMKLLLFKPNGEKRDIKQSCLPQRVTLNRSVSAVC